MSSEPESRALTQEDDMEHSNGRRWRAGLVAAGAAMGLTLAGLGIADAQTDSGDESTTTAPADPAPSTERAVRPHMKGGPGHRGGPGRGLAMGIHGEFTTRNADATGFQTMATQNGEVTEVSASSITVKSIDGFSRTYAVNDDTLVNAGNNGIADVAVGDDVHVLAIVEGGNARAVDIHDGSQIRELRGKWAPRRSAAADDGKGEDS